MCKHCKNPESHEEVWQQQVVEEDNAKQILGEMIEKSEALLDFYCHVQIEGSKREAKVQCDLIDALAKAKKYYF